MMELQEKTHWHRQHHIQSCDQKPVLVEATSAELVQTMCGTSELQKTECVYIIMQIYTSLVGHHGATGHECWEKNNIYWERNYTTASRVRFSGTSTAFDVSGMGVMSTGLAGASIATLMMAGWECSVLAMLDGAVTAVGGLCALAVGGYNGQICPCNCAGWMNMEEFSRWMFSCCILVVTHQQGILQQPFGKKFTYQFCGCG